MSNSYVIGSKWTGKPYDGNTEVVEVVFDPQSRHEWDLIVYTSDSQNGSIPGRLFTGFRSRLDREWGPLMPKWEKGARYYAADVSSYCTVMHVFKDTGGTEALLLWDDDSYGRHVIDKDWEKVN